ncbi:glycoside hydrolase family 88 protein [Anaerocolumna sp.]|uniref:glycoside hydrolase family 88 protein n=1 Tax=Anaerocolumna sp. TaxID=2041569 RepID=UPI0028A8B563|nr:glycoside hydrolase family 88 protein [Anaerocolumna sp.]
MGGWTEGFFTGELWLIYEWTKNEKYSELAKKHVETLKNRIQNHIRTNHHDMGFLYSPSCVAAYKLCGLETGREAALLAADNLISRFQEKGSFIQAWGELGEKDNYRMIIDCLINLPLLYWATEETKDDKYRNYAGRHLETALKYIMREDSSTYHTYFFDNVTGEPLYGVTHQGYRDDSAWARGQAWGIYGVALGYRYLQKQEYITIFKRITDYFIEHLPEDLVPFWDFDFTDGSTDPRDSSAAAIAVCGMLEMIKYLPEQEAHYYGDMAERILLSLINNYSVKDPDHSNGQLLHGTYSKSSPYNTCPDNGVDECNAWGDYYYLEALMRVNNPEWKLYW